MCHQITSHKDGDVSCEEQPRCPHHGSATVQQSINKPHDNVSKASDRNSTLSVSLCDSQQRGLDAVAQARH